MQIERLLSAGFPCMLLNAVTKAFLQQVKGDTTRRTPEPALKTAKPEVALYIYKFAHALKKEANRH